MRNKVKAIVIAVIVAVFLFLTVSIIVLVNQMFDILIEISNDVNQAQQNMQEIYAEDVKQEQLEYVEYINSAIAERFSTVIEGIEKVHPFITDEMQKAIDERNARLQAEAEEEAKRLELIAQGGQPLYESYVDDICTNLYPDVPASMIKAMIERESHWNSACLGDHGTSYGLMQIKPKWHQWRADKLGVTDWLDPYGNILIGCDLMNDYIQKYDSLALALMVYNGGAKYAQNNYSAGVISNYARGVLEEAGLPVR